ncbi:MAG: aminotransferase class I/II-fold pyridoxal phosphate-dependent enzyme [Sphingobacteriales bacterium]|nr:aminotransferase class I/II-fold pyridoxal phosphate-dependent enzyme [Sphingobacteriales bacterium]MBK7526324.1 aminotransferase class I/II-fold pyridoxal phosphate-dependent enzyme [Sphingobacteriales bacterium]MBP9142648.1 aminotransferase class I/II-fold pyridoxal phosphate-dependent enzyme [Chitinophagales bacterium]MCC7058589.1 aminotransferase class I/II-fold pyridoxal phosphate-dependent enzyme [Chitinophagales bacterium]MDA0198196.1 aminotransferase class I/II-fold pyridoxal phospha
MSIFNKCYEYTVPDHYKALGIYPYFRTVEESEGPIVKMEGREVIMAGSNNYLGLTAHPNVKLAAVEALLKYGTSCSGSRFLTGTIDLHVALETRLAKFVNKEAALLFSTGFQTGQGVLFPLVGRGDIIFSDRDNHASIVAGNLLGQATGCKVVRYKHNDMKNLERVLQIAPPEANKIIVSDGVFSTFGTIVNLPELNHLAKQYNAAVLLDDAHAFGIIGQGGRGTANEFGLDADIDLIMCTFSKSLASLGGFVAGEERVINYLRHTSQALIFSASPTPASVAAAIAALNILEDNPNLVQKVVQNAQVIRTGLRNMGYNVPEGRSAIVPIIIGDDELTFRMWKILYDAGVFVNAFIAPATPPGRQMLRTSYMASHEPEHLNKILNVFDEIKNKFGVGRFSHT